MPRKEDFIFILIIISFFVAMFILFDSYAEYRCENYEEITGRKSKWVFMDACYVKTSEGKWIRYDTSHKD